MEVPSALSYHLGVEAEWAHSFPHRDSLPALIRHPCDWRPEFSACQLIWSHRYGSNLIWGERAGFCQYGWDKAAAFTNPLNKLSREGPVSWQWSFLPIPIPVFNESPYLTFTSTCQRVMVGVKEGKKKTECCANLLVLKSIHVKIKEKQNITVYLNTFLVLDVFWRQSGDLSWIQYWACGALQLNTSKVNSTWNISLVVVVQPSRMSVHVAIV